jgi:hypothetical protein
VRAVGDACRLALLAGFFRFLTDSSKEARDCLFNYSSTYASRKISLRVFNHVQVRHPCSRVCCVLNEASTG